MSKEDKDADARRRPDPPAAGDDAPAGIPRRKPAPPRLNADKLASANKQFNARRNLPFGPLGGSGRKTNRSRSS